MPNCHQCNLLVPAVRQAPQCSYCFAVNVGLCPNCAWWELGPVPAPGAAAALTPAEQRQQLDVSAPCPLRHGQTSAALATRRDNTLLALEAQCDQIRQDLADPPFRAMALQAMELYDRVYFDEPTAVGAGPAAADEVARQTEFHTMIVVALSARRMVSIYPNAHPYTVAAYNPLAPPAPPPPELLIHRHDAPRLRRKHLDTCFLAAFFRPAVAPIALLAMESLIVERLLRNKLTLAQAVRKYQTDHPALNVADLRSLIVMETILYHLLAGSVPVDPVRAVFNPLRAHGFLSQVHRDSLFGPGAAHPVRFTAPVRLILDTLFMAVGVAGAPALRWPDATITAPPIAALLTPRQQAYLQSLPTFDHTGPGAVRSACENNIRARVVSRMKEILLPLVDAPPAVPHRTINAAGPLQDADRNQWISCNSANPILITIPHGLGFDFQPNETIRLEQAGAGIITLIPAPGAELRGQFSTTAAGDVLVLGMTGGVYTAMLRHQPERITRVRNTLIHPVLNAGAAPAVLEPLLDALIDDMNHASYWVESSHTLFFVDLYSHSAALPAAQVGLANETWLRRSVGNTWAQQLPLCPLGAAGTVPGNYDGMRFHPLDLRDRTDGRQNARDWYLDWRVDKDQAMYDCADFPLDELAVFTSLMPWDNVPEPNDTYGTHMFLWNPNILRRAVLTVGDWGHPRRSKLLILQDLLFRTPRKDGSPYSGASQKKKFRTFERLLRHLNESLLHPSAAPPVNRYVQAISDPPDCQFNGPKLGMITDHIENLEAHVFGSVQPSRDAVAIVVCLNRNSMGAANPPIPNQNLALANRLMAKRLAEGLPWQLAAYNHNEGRNARADLPLQILTGNDKWTTVISRPPSPVPPL